jgi:hypothetical protein
MDGGHVRALARVVHEAADGVRSSAERLGAAHEVAWTSVAAGEFRARLVTERARVLEAAGHLDDATVALLRHAAALDGAAR